MKAHSPKIIAEINITPLTDIFLVLLIIMMVVAPMLNYNGLKLAVPAVEQSSQMTESPKTINLVITPQDTYKIDGKAYDFYGVVQYIRSNATTKPDGVIVQANPQSSHNALAKAMDAAQMAGVTKIAVMEDQPAEPTTPEAPPSEAEMP